MMTRSKKMLMATLILMVFVLAQRTTSFQQLTKKHSPLGRTRALVKNTSENLLSTTLLDPCLLRILVSDVSGGRNGNVLVKFAPLFGVMHHFDLFVALLGPNWGLQWSQCFPTIGSYWQGQRAKNATVVYERLTSNTTCPVGRLIENGRKNKHSLEKLGQALVQKLQILEIKEIEVARLIRNDTSLRLPELVTTKPWGSGSMWWNFDLFTKPQHRFLQESGLRPTCCKQPTLLKTAQPADLHHFTIHFRDFRSEFATGPPKYGQPQLTIPNLTKHPTLRASYIVQLLRRFNATRVRLVAEQSFLKSSDSSAVRNAFPELETNFGRDVDDFCALYGARGTLVVSPSSSFSYWPAILGHAQRVIVPSVRGVRANTEPDSGRNLRKVWPSAAYDCPSIRCPKYLFEIVPHSAIDTRYPNGTEIPWIDFTFDNGSSRPIPIQRPQSERERKIKS